MNSNFRWGVRRRQCSWDPASFSELPAARVYDEATPHVTRTPRSLTPDEAKRFIEAAAGDPNEALLLTAISTGLRPGELLALRWADIRLTDTIDVAVEPMGKMLGNSTEGGSEDRPIVGSGSTPSGPDEAPAAG